MQVVNTSIEGLLKIIYNNNYDKRGKAGKIFCQEMLEKMNIDFKINDLFQSVSKKNTIRGMHFQTYPFEQQKLVYVAQGEIIDIIVDLRKDSKTYKKYEVFKLNKENNEAVFIPEGCAHGFKSTCDGSIVIYAISGQYNKAHDLGIRWDSFGYDWGVDDFIISERDEQLPTLEKYCELTEGMFNKECKSDE